MKGPLQSMSSVNTSIDSDNRVGMLWRKLNHDDNYIDYALQLALNQSHSTFSLLVSGYRFNWNSP